MEKHVCKLCLRHFPNGRALGGHMRSHVLAAKHQQQQQEKQHQQQQQEKQEKQQQQQPNSPPSSSSSSSYEAIAKRKLYALRENPRKSIRLSDPEFYGGGDHHHQHLSSSSSSLQDRESDTESKQHRRLPDYLDPESLSSSVSNTTTPDEDVALSLVLLSRHAWSTHLHSDESNRADGGPNVEDKDGFAAVGSKKAERFLCETCHRSFGSYQALGGHRASHKKVPKSPLPDADPGSDGSDAALRIHECPFCFRVFPSGQALGGHKRSHLVASSRAFTSPPVVADGKHHHRLIDLNLPAPVDELEDGVSSQVYSAVSNADP